MTLLKEKRTCLHNPEIFELQNRVTHYLNSYELEKNRSPHEIAQLLSLSEEQYDELKNPEKENNIYFNFQLLKNIAHLKGIGLTELMVYLENDPNKNITYSSKNELEPWEKDILRVINSLEVTARRFYLTKLISKTAQEQKLKGRLEIGIIISTIIAYLTFEDLENLTYSILNLTLSTNYTFKKQEHEDEEEGLKRLRILLTKFMKNNLASPI